MGISTIQDYFLFLSEQKIIVLQQRAASALSLDPNIFSQSFPPAFLFDAVGAIVFLLAPIYLLRGNTGSKST